MTVIPLDRCRHGCTYRIKSRNLLVGVFDQRRSGFVGIRHKFERIYLFTEFHYDTGAFGTVEPIEEIEKCPVEDLREHFDSTCAVCGKVVFFNRNGRSSPETGGWEHIEDSPTLCRKAIAADGNVLAASINMPLFEYLRSIEASLDLKHEGGGWKPGGRRSDEL
jgi:hypothetical protein